MIAKFRENARLGAVGRVVLLLSFLLCTISSGFAQSKDCPYCSLKGKSFAGQDLRNVNFSGAMLDEADFRGANLAGAIFINASLVRAKFDNAQLGVSGSGPVNFSLANLTGATFTGATMTGAILQYANMDGADFSNANLTNAVPGAKLMIGANGSQAPKFTNTTLSCDFKFFAGQIDVSTAKFPACDGLRKAMKVSDTMVQITVPTDPTQPTLVVVSVPGVVVDKDTNHTGPMTAPAGVNDATDTVRVSATGTDNSGCGSAASPCKTINQAAQNVRENGVVAVDYGQYALTGTIPIQKKIILIGGYFSGQRTDYQSAVTAPPDGAPAFTVTGSGVSVRFINFIISGTSASSANRSSIAMQCTGGATLVLTNTNVNAARGGPGAQGAQGEIGHNGAPGGAGNENNDGKGGKGGGSWYADGNGGWGGDRSWSNLRCSGWCTNNTTFYNFSGGYGGAGSTGVWTNGGNYANGVAYLCPYTERPGAAPSADTGKAAGCGGAGNASGNNMGSFSNGNWVTVAGGSGNAGGNGAGGGGGGSGGACTYCNCGCSGSDYKGTAGGGGGGGGGGGQGGIGGNMGGPSFGIVLQNSACVADNTVKITAGLGGDGGTGGKGNSGGTGGAGGSAQAANNVCNNTGSAGGNGGKGGTGGAGGGGAGGNGGASVCIALVGNCNITGAPVYYKGASGKPGSGGAGGTPAAGNACNGTTGNSGNSGRVENTIQY